MVASSQGPLLSLCISRPNAGGTIDGRRWLLCQGRVAACGVPGMSRCAVQLAYCACCSFCFFEVEELLKIRPDIEIIIYVTGFNDWNRFKNTGHVSYFWCHSVPPFPPPLFCSCLCFPTRPSITSDGLKSRCARSFLSHMMGRVAASNLKKPWIVLSLILSESITP